MSSMTFKFGDRVIHTGRPEWGAGVISSVQNVTENGEPVQRITLRFERAGLKTLSSPPARLEIAPADGVPMRDTPSMTNGHSELHDSGWLGKLEGRTPLEIFMSLPEETRDPFNSHTSRLKATFDLYRFSNQGGSLLDWAAAQSGLRDPLSKFSRHELEQFFHRFALERDAHLKKLVLEAKKMDDPQVRQLLDNPPASAKDALRRVHSGR